MRDDRALRDASADGRLLQRGGVAGLLARLAFPVLALPPRALHRVLLHGQGIELPVEDGAPAVGFYVTYYVPARTAEAAGARAVRELRDRWRRAYAGARGELEVGIEEVERLPGRFARRARTGLVFYAGEQDSKGP